MGNNSLSDVIENKETPIGDHPNLQEAIRSVTLVLNQTPRDAEVTSHFLYCEDLECSKTRKNACNSIGYNTPQSEVLNENNGSPHRKTSKAPGEVIGHHLEHEELLAYLRMVFNDTLPVGIIAGRIQSHLLHCNDPGCNTIELEAFAKFAEPEV